MLLAYWSGLKKNTHQQIIKHGIHFFPLLLFSEVLQTAVPITDPNPIIQPDSNITSSFEAQRYIVSTNDKVIINDHNDFLSVKTFIVSLFSKTHQKMLS